MLPTATKHFDRAAIDSIHQVACDLNINSHSSSVEEWVKNFCVVMPQTMTVCISQRLIIMFNVHL